MTQDRQRMRANSNIMSASSLLYACYVQLQYYVKFVNKLDLPMHYVIYCYWSNVYDVVPQSYRGPVFWFTVYISVPVKEILIITLSYLTWYVLQLIFNLV